MSSSSDSTPPPNHDAGTVTRLLGAARSGDPEAAKEVFSVVYLELKRLAEALMRSEAQDHTWQPTALVHEAYLKLVAERGTPEDRRTYMSFAARAMRNLLVDHSRWRGRRKRPQAHERRELTPELRRIGDHQVDLVMVNEAFERLCALYPEAARCFELWYFANLQQKEIATLMNVDRHRVARNIRQAKAWLAGHLRMEDGDGGRTKPAGR